MKNYAWMLLTFGFSFFAAIVFYACTRANCDTTTIVVSVVVVFLIFVLAKLCIERTVE